MTGTAPPLTADAWPAFFSAVHGPDRRPFRWQTRLLETVLAEGRWPQQIAAPTGAGKTAVIDVHTFAVAMMAARTGPVLPRRLALVVDRRALVDDQFDHARFVARRLAAALRGEHAHPTSETGTALAAVASALAYLRWPAALEVDGGSPLVVARLRGGLPAPTGWRDDPVAAAVICATPDMWGSRLLLRGYGASSAARPRETGLLGRDAVVVLDEAHLSEQLLRTARRVAELEQLTEPELGVPTLQVVETTATPQASADQIVAVTEDDLDADEALRDRLRKPKPVRIVELSAWPSSRPGKARDQAISQLADEVVRLRAQVSGGTVGCFVNTVSAAVAVHHALRATDGLNVQLLVGRMRPYDVARLREAYPGLLDARGNEGVDVLVATQTLEVGVDVDLAAAVTELAPGSAIAQRTGRVNRLGTRDTGPITVVTGGEFPQDDSLGPYRTADLQKSLDWLRAREQSADGLAPWALRADDDTLPPRQGRRRTLNQRVEPADTWHLARTSDELAAEPDLSLWLADDLKLPLDIGVAVRRDLPPDDEVDLVELLRNLPPRPHEVFPVPLDQARDALKALLAVDPRTGTGSSSPMARVRGRGEVAPLRDETDLRAELRPGDVVVVGENAKIFKSGVVVPDGTDTATDVLEAPSLDKARPGPAGGAVRLERRKPGEDAVLDEVFDAALAAAADKRSRADRNRLAAALTTLAQQAGLVARPAAPGDTPTPAAPSGEALAWAAKLLKEGAIKSTTVILQAAEDAEPHRLLVIDNARTLKHDEELRQTWTTADGPVSLATHAAAVATRAAEVGRSLRLGGDLVEVLRLAGLHHDDGKTDPRFQRMLRGDDGDTDSEPLAKSGVTSPARAREMWKASGLPVGWRHEQLSVVLALPALDDLPRPTRDLVARLVGTSHGRGRHVFPHTATALVPDTASAAHALAKSLFDEGEWDDLIDATTQEWGTWGSAFLEAVLRAADGQISAEGT